MTFEELEEIALANRVSQYKIRAVKTYAGLVSSGRKELAQIADIQNKKNISTSDRSAILNADKNSVGEVSSAILKKIIIEHNPSAFEPLKQNNELDPGAPLVPGVNSNTQINNDMANNVEVAKATPPNNNNTLIILIIIAIAFFMYKKYSDA